MGLTPGDLVAAPTDQPPPRPSPSTSRSYPPPVSDGCRRAYGSYWNRVIEHWGEPRLDELTPSEIRQLVQHVQANVVPRRNARGGRSAAEHLIAALRCLYKHAEEDGLINPADKPGPEGGQAPPPALDPPGRRRRAARRDLPRRRGRRR